MTEKDIRQHILTTAVTVAAQKGLANTSLNDIIRQSGVSKGGVYWHFKNKDELITAVFDLFFQGQEVIMETVMNGSGTAVDKMIQWANLSGSSLQASFSQLPSPMEFYALAARSKPLRQRLQTYYNQYHSHACDLLRTGIDEEAWSGNIDIESTAHTIISTFEGVILVWALFPEEIHIGDQMSTAVQLLLNGLSQT